MKNQVALLFDDTKPVLPSQWLQNALAIANDLPLRSEKAKSEWIVVPILTEMRMRNDKFFTIFSGENLNADAKRGLKGECDFILTKDEKSMTMSYPIVQVVEAKKQDFELGIPQCAAQLLGASIINQKKQATINTLYGCATIGKAWQFIKLENNILYIDNRIYTTQNLPELLGVFQVIIDYYKKILA
jgi:hypothetical protein